MRDKDQRCYRAVQSFFVLSLVLICLLAACSAPKSLSLQEQYDALVTHGEQYKKLAMAQIRKAPCQRHSQCTMAFFSGYEICSIETSKPPWIALLDADDNTKKLIQKQSEFARQAQELLKQIRSDAAPCPVGMVPQPVPICQNQQCTLIDSRDFMHKKRSNE